VILEERDVRRALQEGEFVPHFQPIIALQNGSLRGFEALARWAHPSLGLVSPGDFIAAAESDGWIGDLTHAILRHAFTAFAALPSSFTLSVNISPVQLHDLGMAKQIRAIADSTGFSLSRLTVEITESALVDNLEHASLIAKQLKSMGCRLSLDDFGTAYSSLLHLQALPFDELKVDRSFVGSMTERRQSRKIVAAVIGLGQTLGLTTVAEGVETEHQARLLRWLGCDSGQGWLYGKPIAGDKLADYIANTNARQVLPRPWGPMSLAELSGLPAQRLAQLQAVYDGAPVGLALLNAQLRYVNLNQRLADLSGLSVEEHLGRSFLELFPISGKVESMIWRALHGESLSGLELTRTLNEPPYSQTLLVSYQPVRDEAREVIGVSVAVVDISERKRMEEALRESEDHYRHMVELNPQIPWILDDKGNVLDVSPKWYEVTGQTAEEIAGRGWLNGLHPEDRGPTEAAMEKSLHSGEPIDVEYRVGDDERGWRWIRARGAPRRDETGKIDRWYGTSEDIDDRKRIQDDLQRSEARLKAVFESVPVGIILADAPEGTLRLANREARAIFRSPILPGPGMNNYSQWRAFRANGTPLESEDYPLARALRGETAGRQELLCHFADGTKRWLALSGAPVLDGDGAIIGGVVVVEAIDEPSGAKS
jgi:PAS domain S-box-containing protein